MIGILLLVFLIFANTPVVEVVAPPSFIPCYPSIITLNSGAKMTDVEINMTIETIGNVLLTVEVEGALKLTNMDGDSQNVLLLYTPNWYSVLWPSLISNFSSRIVGEMVHFEQIDLTNLTEPIHLPPNFPSYESNRTDYHNALINLTLPGETAVDVFFVDNIRVTCDYPDQFQIGFGFNRHNIINASTRLDCRISVPKARNVEYYCIWFGPDEGRNITEDDTGYLTAWSIAPPYSSAFLSNFYCDPITAGFLCVIVLNEYHPPGPSTWTTTTTQTTSTTTTHNGSTLTNNTAPPSFLQNAMGFALLGSLIGGFLSMLVLMVWSRDTGKRTS